MNHADALNRLEEYFDGTLSPAAHREIEAHLAGCESCRDELSSLGALLDTVAELREKRTEPPRDLWPDIATRIAMGPRSEAGREDAPRKDAQGPVGFTSQRSVQVLGFTDLCLLTPLRRLYPLPVRQASILPAASFRFRLTTDTLAV